MACKALWCLTPQSFPRTLVGRASGRRLAVTAAHQARHLEARAVSNQMDASRRLCDSGIESECFNILAGGLGAVGARTDAATLGIGKAAADGDSIDSRSH
jgi:hypothetical protein